MSSGARPPLSRERVLAAALELIDEQGLAGFTMRALGARLGVEAMSIYKHLPSKRAVLDGVVARLLGEFETTWRAQPRPTNWREHLEAFGHAFLGLSEAHPQAFTLLSQRTLRAYVVGQALTEEALATLIADGFDRARAVAALRLVVRFTIGFALSAPAPVPADDAGGPDAAYPLVGQLTADLGQPATERALFAHGLRALLTGIAIERAGFAAGAAP